MRQIFASITQRLRLPVVCILCTQYHRNSYVICNFCHSLLKPIGSACVHCALPLMDDKFLLCGHCSKKKPVFDRVLTAYRFEEPLRTLLHQFKYQEALYLRSYLSQLFFDALPKEGLQTQCLVPVPLHPKKLKQRGFNQAAELAKLLSKRLGVPYDLNLCKKIIHTNPQVNLNSIERRKNVRNSFQAKPSVYTKVTLIDDLITTGSTVNELAFVLKNRGVERVDVWCCARASLE